MRKLLCLAMYSFAACGEPAPEPTPAPASPTSKPTTTTTTDPAHHGGSAKAGDLPCAIDALVKARCQSCHGDPLQYGAPVPLFDVADFQAPDGATTIGVKAWRYMNAMGKTMPPPPNERATADEIAAFEAWVDAGMPPKDASETCDDHHTDPPPPPPPPAETCDAKPNVAPKSKFTLDPANTDTYVCYGFDIPGDAKKRHVIQMTPKIDNTSIVHHVLIFTTDKARSGTPALCPPMEQDWKMLFGWAPGAQGGSTPPEAGFPIEAGDVTHLVVQIHYSNPTHASGKSDGSGAELCLTKDLRDNDADFMVFGGTDFSIDPGQKLRMVCDVTARPELATYLPVTVFSTFPHMHKLGTRQKLEIIPKTGSAKTLIEVAPWDFNHQISYSADNSLKVGDKVRITCEWNNTTAAPVSYGEETAEEMCFNFISYYPKIDNPQWSYLAPLSLSSCSTTPL